MVCITTTSLTALEQHIDNIDMVCNPKKSICMIFEPRERSKIMSVSFPQFMIGGSLLYSMSVFVLFLLFCCVLLCLSFLSFFFMYVYVYVYLMFLWASLPDTNKWMEDGYPVPYTCVAI